MRRGHYRGDVHVYPGPRPVEHDRRPVFVPADGASVQPPLSGASSNRCIPWRRELSDVATCDPTRFLRLYQPAKVYIYLTGGCLASCLQWAGSRGVVVDDDGCDA